MSSNLTSNTNSFLHRSIINICRYEYPFFLRKANVVAVCLGFKEINKINTYEKCIRVYVTEKLSINNLNHNDIIPTFYKGFKTDVISSGGPIIDYSLTNRVRPTTGGYSVGNSQLSIGGTLGCLVTDTSGTKYILSCNHVLAKNIPSIGSPILQPSIRDKGIVPFDIVANLSSYVPIINITLSYEYPNFVDCAIAEIITPDIASPVITFIGTPKGINIPMLDECVTKVGKVTELTMGRIQGISATIYKDDDVGNKALFVDQIITDDMAKGGDSGAILLNDKKEALGLLMSGTPFITVYNSIENVLRALRVRLVVQ